jgi:hypothetical protein
MGITILIQKPFVYFAQCLHILYALYKTTNFITTRTMCEVINSGGVRYHSTTEPGEGSVDRRECKNYVNEQSDMIFYTS